MSLTPPSPAGPFKYVPSSAATVRIAHMASVTRVFTPEPFVAVSPLEPLVSVESDPLKPFIFPAAVTLALILWLLSFYYVIISERQRRAKAEDEKRTIESQIEELTSTLFEEAMKKCEAAWREKAELEKRNEQLNVQLRDMKILLAGKGDGMQGWAAFMEAAGSKGGRDNRTHSRKHSRRVSTSSVGLDLRFKPQVVPPLPVQ